MPVDKHMGTFERGHCRRRDLSGMRQKPADCLAIEDSHAGVHAAYGAGMQTVMVPDLVAPSPEVRNLCTIMASLHEVRDAAFAVDPVG